MAKRKAKAKPRKTAARKEQEPKPPKFLIVARLESGGLVVLYEGDDKEHAQTEFARNPLALAWQPHKAPGFKRKAS